MKAPEFKDCPEGLVVCLDTDGALVLRDDVEALVRWTDEAWARCGVRETR